MPDGADEPEASTAASDSPAAKKAEPTPSKLRPAPTPSRRKCSKGRRTNVQGGICTLCSTHKATHAQGFPSCLNRFTFNKTKTPLLLPCPPCSNSCSCPAPRARAGAGARRSRRPNSREGTGEDSCKNAGFKSSGNDGCKGTGKERRKGARKCPQDAGAGKGGHQSARGRQTSPSSGLPATVAWRGPSVPPPRSRHRLSLPRRMRTRSLAALSSSGGAMIEAAAKRRMAALCVSP